MTGSEVTNPLQDFTDGFRDGWNGVAKQRGRSSIYNNAWKRGKEAVKGPR